MSIRNRWREWQTRREEQRNVANEMAFHIEQETAHNIRRGMAPEQARREAQKSFGGIDRFAEAARDERTGTKLSDFAMSYLDWKLGARMLLRHPALSIIGGITLTSAIGLAVAWFTFTMVELYPKVPLPDGDRIVSIKLLDVENQDIETRMLHDFATWREQLKSIENLGVVRKTEHNLITADGVSRPVHVAELTASLFDVATIQPVLGRTLTPEDENPGAPNVVVISHELWQQRFGGDHRALGTEIRIGSTWATLVGVMPEGYRFPSHYQAWVPYRITQTAPPPEPRSGPYVSVIGRLRDGVTLESAQAELSAIGARMSAANPATHKHLLPRAAQLGRPTDPDAASDYLIPNLLGWALLAVACGNVAALMFARTAMRESEIVVRNALGASRSRVMAQLYAEALVLTSMSAFVGLVGAAIAMRYLSGLYAGDDTPFWRNYDVPPIAILYTILLAVVGAAIVALLPALRATGKHVADALRNMSTGGGTCMRFGGTWSAIIVIQVAVAVLALPFGIAMALSSLEEFRQKSTFPAEQYLTFRAELNEDDVGKGSFEELQRRIAQQPGVRGVTVASDLPGLDQPWTKLEAQRADGTAVPIDTNMEDDWAESAYVGAEYFDVFDLPAVAGRTLRDADVRSKAPVAVVSESLAKNIAESGGGTAVGMHIRTAELWGDPAGPWLEVVGVVRDLGLEPSPSGEPDVVYWPALAESPGTNVAVRLSGDATTFGPAVQELAAEVAPELRIYEVMTLRAAIRKVDLPIIQVTFVIVGVVLLAIILSAASLYALMSVSVMRRRREIGIRLAIGSSRRAILAALFRRAAIQVGVGIVLGNAVVLQLLPALGEEMSPDSIVPAMLFASLVMALVGIGACFVPGRRALNVQPTEAFKEAR